MQEKKFLKIIIFTRGSPKSSTRPLSDFPCREVNKMETPNPKDWDKSNNKNENFNEQDMGRETKFSLSKQDTLMLLAMASLSLMAALDGTSISVALPVSYPVSVSSKCVYH